ncbi:4-hydroxy-tetrahydrodipicolinate reductase [Candidatus Gromoviella agglomerans]|uniref:4-hydroxy-tetrahydrodipicolinate reductase n=1 Tax=Candidatus Gromoviella agglomerans TaxID=2806609 RepID=UPI001E3A83F5|nr:dihydrodipicolinate reductase C-terminal domain-containing protein [Candidatus Gromoviella agglomerans]UFX98536.1 4-hydroxy-tetrahydrodipicolinate reductase [Candidatus Gromoviella agglomerans]
MYELSSKNIQIILIGYGKMGHAIESLIQKNDLHSIINNEDDFKQLCILASQNEEFLQNIVIIDFSDGTGCLDRIKTLLGMGSKIISGTTGWNYEFIYENWNKFPYTTDSAFLHSSNFSIGVNIFWNLIKQATKTLSKFNFSATGHEIHHAEKKDAPSGTAKKTLEIIREHIPNTREFSFERKGNEKGTHTVSYFTEFEEISISHKALSREIFAKGAIEAGIWISKRKGIFSMSDFLKDYLSLDE